MELLDEVVKEIRKMMLDSVEEVVKKDNLGSMKPA
jgi:hypothetical protein